MATNTGGRIREESMTSAQTGAATGLDSPADVGGGDGACR
jgi:hypothetical protein